MTSGCPPPPKSGSGLFAAMRDFVDAAKGDVEAKKRLPIHVARGVIAMAAPLVDKQIANMVKRIQPHALSPSEMHQRQRRKSMLLAFGQHEAARLRHLELTGRELGVEAPLP